MYLVADVVNEESEVLVTVKFNYPTVILFEYL